VDEPGRHARSVSRRATPASSGNVENEANDVASALVTISCHVAVESCRALVLVSMHLPVELRANGDVPGNDRATRPTSRTTSRRVSRSVRRVNSQLTSITCRYVLLNVVHTSLTQHR
jgi:hypothetical protein